MENYKDLVTKMGKAVADGDLEAVKSFVKERPEILNEMTVFGTWLHRAATNGQLEVAQYLIYEGIDVNQNGGINEKGAICNAITTGQLEMVKLLVENNVVFDTSEVNKNPLFCAISCRQFEIVKYLIELGADLSIKYKINNAERDVYLYSKYNGTEEITEYIAQKMKEKNIPIMEAKEEKKRIYDKKHKRNLEKSILKEMFNKAIKESVFKFLEKYSDESIFAISFRMYYDAYKPEDRYQCEIIMQTKEGCQEQSKDNEECLFDFKYNPEEYKYAEQGSGEFLNVSNYLFLNCCNLEVCYELEGKERDKMEEAIAKENLKIERILAEAVSDLRKKGSFKDKSGNHFYIFPYINEDSNPKELASNAKIMNQGLDITEFIEYISEK